MKKPFLTIIIALSVLLIGACDTVKNEPVRVKASNLRGITRINPNPVPQPTTNDNINKVALIIGNAKYHHAALRNTINDAYDMKTVLKSLGFQVILKTNLNQKGMDSALR